MNDAALAVIGSGSVGSVALWQASNAGLPTIGFEAESPGHARSAVGGDTRLFRMTYRDAHPYYPILLEADTGHSILHQCGGLYIGVEDGPYVPALLRNIEQTGDLYTTDSARLLGFYRAASGSTAQRASPAWASRWPPHSARLPRANV